jgi:hypothetical protein
VTELLVSGGTSCSSSEDESRPEPDTPARTVTPTDLGRAAAELIGAWESSRAEENTTLAYRFTGDGRYRYAAGLTQPRPGRRSTPAAVVTFLGW